MQIRNGQADDVPAIVELLKKSLGEGLLPKSEKLWNWKHQANPFGPSPVLLAEENGLLVGVRTFLKWEFIRNEKVLHACRAVDTAVHPDFQGKGIFTQMTLELVRQMREEKHDLIFNTPNQKSTPGYLKMGWEEYRKLPVFLGFRPTLPKKPSIEPADWSQVTELIQKFESTSLSSDEVKTHLVPGYIHWRYVQCPLFPYQYISDGKSFLLVYRIKESSWGNEFRCCDLFTSQEFDQNSSQALASSLKETFRQSHCLVISFSGQKENQHLGMNFLPKLSLGPSITLKQLAFHLDAKDLPWSWSLGDLEVF